MSAGEGHAAPTEWVQSEHGTRPWAHIIDARKRQAGSDRKGLKIPTAWRRLGQQNGELLGFTWAPCSEDSDISPSRALFPQCVL